MTISISHDGAHVATMRRKSFTCFGRCAKLACGVNEDRSAQAG